MADIRITIEGARGAGKTTLAKYLYNLFVNGTYFVEKVLDSDTLSTNYIQNLMRGLAPVKRQPRSIEIRVLETGFVEEIYEGEDEDNEDDFEL